MIVRWVSTVPVVTLCYENRVNSPPFSRLASLSHMNFVVNLENYAHFCTFHVTASLPEYFVLLPTKPVTMLHGQDANVTCESVGVTTTKLQWKKQTDSGEGPVPDSMVTIVKDQSTNRVRAILKITNAQKKDSGFYKCVMTVSGKTDYKMTRIILDGKI